MKVSEGESMACGGSSGNIRLGFGTMKETVSGTIRDSTVISFVSGR